MLKAFPFFIQIIIISCSSLFSQSEKSTVVELQLMAAKLYEDHADSVKYNINSRVEDMIEVILENSNAKLVGLDTLNFLKVLSAEDGKFNLLSWAYPSTGDRFQYSGFLQILDDHGGPDSLIRFVYEEDGDELFKIYQDKNWPGAVYYKLIEKTSKKNLTYTLLAWVGAETGKAKRVIEILDFDQEGNPQFGKPVFMIAPEKIQNRMIFEYTDEVPFHLNYEIHPLPNKKKKKEGMIIFNRLVGNNPQMGRMFNGSVPDYSVFDGLIFEEGKWLLYRDLDLRVDTDNLNNNPKKEKQANPDEK